MDATILFMKEDTIFTKIIKGEIPATKLYEDDDFLAILDINPVRKGHTLLITKEPFVWIQDVPDQLLAKAFVFSKKMIRALKEQTECDYVQVVVEGVEVPHFHIHLIPSILEQKNAAWNHVSYEEGEDVQLAEKIRSSL